MADAAGFSRASSSTSPDVPSPSDANGAAKASRTKRACVQCFKAKVRCSGDHPCCTRCAHKQSQCYYDPTGNHRAKKPRRDPPPAAPRPAPPPAPRQASTSRTSPATATATATVIATPSMYAHEDHSPDEGATTPVAIRQPFFRWLGAHVPHLDWSPRFTSLTFSCVHRLDEYPPAPARPPVPLLPRRRPRSRHPVAAHPRRRVAACPSAQRPRHRVGRGRGPHQDLLHPVRELPPVHAPPRDARPPREGHPERGRHCRDECSRQAVRFSTSSLEGKTRALTASSQGTPRDAWSQCRAARRPRKEPRHCAPRPPLARHDLRTPPPRVPRARRRPRQRLVGLLGHGNPSVRRPGPAQGALVFLWLSRFHTNRRSHALATQSFEANNPAETALRSRIFWAVACLDRIVSCGTGRLTTIPLSQIEVRTLSLHS